MENQDQTQNLNQLTFIVEGFHDEEKLKQLYPTAKYIITHGRPYNSKLKQPLISALTNKETVICLSDPDERGDLIAKSIQRVYPEVIRIRIDPEKCRCTRQHHHKIGIEHADLDYLRACIESYLQQEGVL